MTRPWEGADFVNENLRKFGFSTGDANYDLNGDRDVLEGRSRMCYQNNTFAGAAVDTKCLNVVGTGLTAHPNVVAKYLGITDEQAKAWNDEMEDLFRTWAESKAADSSCELNFYQMQELILKTQSICGDVFALRCSHDLPDSAFLLCYKLLEGNRCKNPNGMNDIPGKLVMGVELSKGGKATAYHFTQTTNTSPANVFGIYPTVRVEASDEFGIRNVIHVKSMDRPGQVRGIPWLAPIIPMIKDKGRLEKTTLLHNIIDALFTVFIKNTGSEAAPTFLGNIEGPERTTPDSCHIKMDNSGKPVPPPKPAIELGSANVIALGQNQEVQTAQHNSPGSTFVDYVHEVDLQMASRLNMSVEQVHKFWVGNYNSVRAALTEAKKAFDVCRENLIVDFCQPVYDAFLHECVMLGYIKCPGYDNKLTRMRWHNVRWIGDAPVMLDPLKEMSAYKMGIDEQLYTRSEVSLAVNGSDYFENVRGFAAEAAARKENGVPEPGAVNRSVSISHVEEPSNDDDANE